MEARWKMLQGLQTRVGGGEKKKGVSHQGRWVCGPCLAKRGMAVDWNGPMGVCHAQKKVLEVKEALFQVSAVCCCA